METEEKLTALVSYDEKISTAIPNSNIQYGKWNVLNITSVSRLIFFFQKYENKNLNGKIT